MTEVGWFIAYSMVGEKQPWITLGPAVAFASTIAVFVLTRRRARLRKADLSVASPFP